MENNNSNNENGNRSLRWWILFTVIIGTFLGRLDQTIVSLALPKMMADFNISVTTAGWIATAYILANAVFVPIWGKLGDSLGRKKIYILGFSIFIFGSILAGLAWNFSSMILFRVIQAVAASADYPTAMAIIAVTFKHGKERAQALGIWSSSFAAAAVFGPLVGGPLVDNFGWRSIFFINLPIGLVGIILAMSFIKESVSEKVEKTFDWWGSIILGISLTALVLVLDKGMDWGWLSLNSLASYAVCLISLYIFIRVEKNTAEPIVDLKFFKNSVFVNSLVNNFIVFMGMMGAIFLLPIFAQTFMGLNATQTGYLFMPMAFFMVLSAPLGGALTGKIKAKYVIFVSTLVASIGLYLFHFLDARSGYLGVIVPLSIMAFGLGFGMAQRTNMIASAVPQEEIGVASSVLALARNIAGAFGIALFGTVLNNTINSNMINLSRLSAFHGQSALEYRQFIALISLKAQISAYGTVFLIASIVVFLGSFTILTLKLKSEKTDVRVIAEG